MIVGRPTLDDMLGRAHARNDGAALVALYTRAADQSEAAGDIDAACFYLTHAYVFALESGSAAAGALKRRLWQHGREPRPGGA